MDRYIIITDTITGQQATCSTFDISDTIGPWYPEADEITTQVTRDNETEESATAREALAAAAVNALPALLAAAAERDALAVKVAALADWHETEADKARRFRIEIDGRNPVMDKAAEVHTDASRRLRRVLGGES